MLINRSPHPKRRALARALGLLTVVSFAGALTACAPGGDAAEEATSPSAGQDAWPRTVETADGTLTLEAAPKRIVSTSTTLTGSLLAVGAPVLASSGTAADVPGLSDSLGFFLQWSDAAQTAGTELLFSNSSPNVEKVIEYEPDLIVVAETGGDSLMDNVDQLRKIAPVMVVNYSGSSWQDITTLFGEATGAEDQAMQAIMQYEAQLAAVKASITVPDHPVSAFFPFASGEGAGAATEFSPHTQILADLGFTLAEIPDEVKGDESMGGAERKDIVNLSAENLQRGLPGETWIMIAADAAAKDLVNTDPAYTSAPAVQAGNVFFTPGETFRLDFFSALILLDSLAQSFAS